MQDISRYYAFVHVLSELRVKSCLTLADIQDHRCDRVAGRDWAGADAIKMRKIVANRATMKYDEM